MHVENPHLRRGELLMSQHRYDLAEEQLRQAIGADPNEPTAYAYLAYCLVEREAWAEATDAAQRAVALDPGSALPHRALARVLFERRLPREARDAVNEAIRLEPHEPGSWAQLAAIEIGDKRWRAALEAAERGLECDAENEGCVNLRAIALTNLGDRAAAGAAIDATLSRNPENPVTHANLGWTRLHEGRPRDAMVHFREALRLDPTSEWARAGIVEAMKARSFIYRIFLAYFLFMNRLRGQAQWAIVIGGYIGFRVLSSVSQSNPKLSPFLMPLMAAYLIFALGTVVSVPLFNLFLLTDRFGRHALSRGQRLGAAVFGASLLPGLVLLVYWAVTQQPGSGAAAIVAGVWVIPVALATMASRGVPLAIISAVAALLGIVGAGIVALALGQVRAPVNDLAMIYAFLCVASTWLANIVGMFKPRPKR